MKTKLLWRFRKGSQSEPFRMSDCGCKVYVYENKTVRFCEKHLSEYKKDFNTLEVK